jgi:quercetin dioxygenase-like cupin family protein
METNSKTIENPLSGEKITFRMHEMGTGALGLTGEIHLAPHGCGPPEHIHPIIEERFIVQSGTLSTKVNGKEQRYTRGQEILVRPGVPHRWWNETDEEIVVDCFVDPALSLDQFLESVFALAQCGKANSRGEPGLLHMAVIMQKYWDVLYLAKPSLPVQKIVLGLLSVIGRMLGYKSEYPYPFTNSR